MRRFPGLSLASIVAFTALLASAQERPAYKDPQRPIDERVRDLVSRMTLEEKVAQTLALWQDKAKIVNEGGVFAPEKAAAIMPNGIGQIARPSEFRAGSKPFLLEPRENGNSWISRAGKQLLGA